MRAAGFLACVWVVLRAGGGLAGGLEVAPVRPRPVPPMFQPGFHLALRGSYRVDSLTTLRLRVPVGRAGQRVRLVFRSGDGSLMLLRATLARAGPDGALASEPVPVTFSGAPGFSIGQWTLVESDPVPFPVDFRDELAVSFEVEGALASSAIDLLPGSFARSGARATTVGPLRGTAWARPMGLATVAVEGPPSRAFVAIGDSITEGYITGDDDLRDSWASRTEAALGVPIVNAGVSGQGFYGALRNLDDEVLALSGITDCLVLLGTNDVSALSPKELTKQMGRLLERLEPFCRTWVGTLPPKEKSNHGDYEAAKKSRLALNAWIRDTLPDVIDFESVMCSPEEVHRFLDGLEVDGIHPSVEGHRVMSKEAVRVLRAHEVGAGSPGGGLQ